MERILLIDDDENCREVTVNTLEKLGFEVVEAMDGNQGLELFASTGPFKAVVCDYEMPGGNGDWVAEQILDKNPQQRVIIMSASQRDLHLITDDRIRTVHKGDFVPKISALLSV